MLFGFLFTTVANRSFFNVTWFLDSCLDFDKFVLLHSKSSRLAPASIFGKNLRKVLFRGSANFSLLQVKFNTDDLLEIC